jgi:hypothetical protein
MATINRLSLDAVLPGGSIRFTEDGLVYAVDLVSIVTGKNKHEAAEVLRRLPNDVYSSKNITKRDTGGRGNSHTKLISFTSSIELIMVLPGQMVRILRLEFVNIIKRYIAGDKTMAQELEMNSNSNEAIHVIAREDQTAVKRRKIDKDTVPQVCYIYATHSTAFPGLVKIGRSANVRSRLSSGNTFSAPCPHQVIAIAPTFDAKRDEKLAHDHFSDFRRSGEFFEISHEAITTFLLVNITSQYQRDLLGFVQGKDGLMIDWHAEDDVLADE